jgi:hypothetical protein
MHSVDIIRIIHVHSVFMLTLLVLIVRTLHWIGKHRSIHRLRCFSIAINNQENDSINQTIRYHVEEKLSCAVCINDIFVCSLDLMRNALTLNIIHD